MTRSPGDRTNGFYDSARMSCEFMPVLRGGVKWMLSLNFHQGWGRAEQRRPHAFSDAKSTAATCLPRVWEVRVIASQRPHCSTVPWRHKSFVCLLD